MSKKKGLYANIHAKRKRIKAGSKEKKARELNLNIFSESDFLKKIKS